MLGEIDGSDSDGAGCLSTHCESLSMLCESVLGKMDSSDSDGAGCLRTHCPYKIPLERRFP